MSPGAAPDIDGRWWPAPAKLNLFLHITGRRADGLHELQTLFQLLDWGDEVWLRCTDEPAILRLDADYAVAAEDDLVVRAAHALQSETACDRGVQIRVRKNVPMGAGLGGGSSDAATVLRVLNRLWACGLDEAELAGIGLGLGADVPVFLAGRTALATGIGEQLVPVELGRRHYLLVMPDLKVSTASIFADPGLKRDSETLSPAAAVSGGGRNDCQDVALRRHPELVRLMDSLTEYGPPRMTGTGSALFVPMPSEAAAREAVQALEMGSASDFKCRYNVRAVGGLDHSPLHRALGDFPATASDRDGT